MDKNLASVFKLSPPLRFEVCKQEQVGTTLTWQANW